MSPARASSIGLLLLANSGIPFQNQQTDFGLSSKKELQRRMTLEFFYAEQ